MLKEYIIKSVFEELGYEPTSCQHELVSSLSEFIAEGRDEDLFLLKGYAGTGKTTIISSLVRVLKKFKIKTVLLAPTGRAAKVFSRYSTKSAFTIHKWIYRQRNAEEGIGVFDLDFNKNSNTVFIVDEASMISNYSTEGSYFGSGALLDDLIRYVYNGRNCKLILVGDVAQLPPVGLDVSPALDKDELQFSYGKQVWESYLDEVVRQSADSGILYNATLLRVAMFSGEAGFPHFDIKGYPDIRKIGGEELIEEISSSYDNYGIGETIVVCRSNKRANRFNQGIRNSILYREEEISSGDILMVVKNNYYWCADSDNMDFIANGDIARIQRIKRIVELYGFRFAIVSLEFADYNEELDTIIMLDTLNIETPSLGYEESRKLYREIEEDYLDEKNKKKRFEKIRENEYFNALQVKFAYSVTCHKAQGGQWSSVFIDQGWIPDDVPDMEYMRWLYTAFTRATERLCLVNFRKEFFEEG